MQQVFTEAFAEGPATSSTDELAARAGQDTPERRAMAALYDRIGELPPELAMFLAGCPAELEEKRTRPRSTVLSGHARVSLPGAVAARAATRRTGSSPPNTSSTFAAGGDILKVAPEALTLLARRAMLDIAHLLRPGHLEQVAAILDDPRPRPTTAPSRSTC